MVTQIMKRINSSLLSTNMWHNHCNEFFSTILFKFALEAVSAVLRFPLSTKNRSKHTESNTKLLQGQMAIRSFS